MKYKVVAGVSEVERPMVDDLHALAAGGAPMPASKWALMSINALVVFAIEHCTPEQWIAVLNLDSEVGQQQKAYGAQLSNMVNSGEGELTSDLLNAATPEGLLNHLIVCADEAEVAACMATLDIRRQD